MINRDVGPTLNSNFHCFCVILQHLSTILLMCNTSDYFAYSQMHAVIVERTQCRKETIIVYVRVFALLYFMPHFYINDIDSDRYTNTFLVVEGVDIQL